MTTDNFILSIVRYGYKLEFKNTPHQSGMPRQYKLTLSEMLAVDKEIDALLKKGAIKKCVHTSGEFVSPIFTRTKSNGKIRIIINLKGLNQFLKYEHFKMENLECVLDLIDPHDWFCSVDLEDAYFAVPIHDTHKKYLRFLWRDELFEYQVLCFGLAPAPRIFTKIFKPIMANLRESGVNCSIYIDDMIIIGSSAQETKHNTDSLVSLLMSLGFRINWEKSKFVPTQEIRHLGLIIDSMRMITSIPEDRVTKLIGLCHSVLAKNRVTIRLVASLIGTMVSCFPGTEWGQLHYRRLEGAKIQALKNSQGNFDATFVLSQRAKDDISWWLAPSNLVPRYFGYLSTSMDQIITSDSSKEGWGAASGNTRTGGRWSTEESSCHINLLELKAAFFAVQALALPNSSVHLHVDNTTAMWYIQNKGGKVGPLDDLTFQLWTFCFQNKIKVYVSYIAGIKNLEADFMSRRFDDSLEWSLNPVLFTKAVSFFDIRKPDVDLFATRLNKKASVYFSFRPDPGSAGTDAFMQCWDNFDLAYAYPPFCLIAKTIKKASREHTDLLLVAPYWPAQSWFSLLLHHVDQTAPGAGIFRFPTAPDTVSLPGKPDCIHPLYKRLNLCAFRIQSNKASKRKD